MRLRFLPIILCCALIAFGFWSVLRRSRTDPAVQVPPNVPGAPEENAVGAEHSSLAAFRVPQSEVTPAAPPGAASEARPPMLPQRPNLPAMIPPSPPGVVPVSPTPTGAAQVSPDEVMLDVDKITLSLRDYRTVMRENPVGTNAEITHSLNGGNPRQARLLPEGQVVNDSGEMIDRWGSPYFFHQLSKDYMEIRSAGPDKVMWTPDDTVSN